MAENEEMKNKPDAAEDAEAVTDEVTEEAVDENEAVEAEAAEESTDEATEESSKKSLFKDRHRGAIPFCKRVCRTEQEIQERGRGAHKEPECHARSQAFQKAIDNNVCPGRVGHT